MRSFSQLYFSLDATTRTNDKIAAMRGYFDSAPPADAAWAVYFLSGRRPKRLLSALLLRRWAAELAGVNEWLQEEAYHAVGDSAETAALLLPPAEHAIDRPLHQWVEGVILSLREKGEAAQRAAVVDAWAELDDPQRYVFNKLITGGFRVGVSQRLLMRALAESAALPEALIAHRLMGAWEPTPDFYAALVHPDTSAGEDISRPYPFFLAYPLEAEPHTLGDVAEWQAEWKWDGIRAQLIRRQGQTFLWSRGEELVTDRYPEIVAAAEALPDCVLDGELLAWDFASARPRPFAALQQRIGRKNLSRKLLAETPVVLLVYDLLEWQGDDWRERPLSERRAQLEHILADAGAWLPISSVVEAASWAELASLREESRGRAVEGLMLKRRASPYRVGRRRGDWWKWKIDPYTIDAVLIYAQRGSGRRAGLYSDYTFALWSGDTPGAGELVPFTKAYGGLTDAEMRQVDAFVRANTQDRFGPVRSVRPELVMEIAFESIQASNRHKAGVAVRFPRMARWRHDKRPDEADTLAALRALLNAEG